jgi:ATP-binding cassette, subfamily C, bacterial CydC
MSERRRLALAIALALGAAAAGIALLAGSGYLISRAAQRPEVLSLMVVIVAVRAFGLARAGLRYSERLVSHDGALRRLTRLRIQFFAALTPLIPGRLTRGGAGDLLARFVGDVDTLGDLHPRGTIPLAAAAIVAPAGALAAWLMLPAAGLAALAALAVPAVVLPLLAYRLSADSARRQAPARAALMSELIESIDGATELSAMGHAERRLRRLHLLDANLARLTRADAKVSALALVIGGLLRSAGLVLVLAVGIAAVHAGSLQAVLLAALVLLVLGGQETLAILPEAARRLHACGAASMRLRQTLTHEPLRPAEPRTLPAPRDGTLAMRQVHFRYGPREPSLLSGASMQIARGERVAVIGESGIGKSTIGELLAGFHQPTQGTITLGGVDLAQIEEQELRSQVLLCGQDAHLFNTTVRENLLIGDRDASDEALAEAISVVRLTGWASQLPDGLDTLIGQDGEQLSGGQRRRLALARALLSDAPYLILDEPTAHLDKPLARALMQDLLAATQDRGLLVLAHAEIADLACFDRVLTLDHRRLVQISDPAGAHLPLPGLAGATLAAGA